MELLRRWLGREWGRGVEELVDVYEAVDVLVGEFCFFLCSAVWWATPFFSFLWLMAGWVGVCRVEKEGRLCGYLGGGVGGGGVLLMMMRRREGGCWRAGRRGIRWWCASVGLVMPGDGDRMWTAF